MPEPRTVLMQRVIALNGIPERPANTPKTPDIDLSRTMHEWGVEQDAQRPSAPQPRAQREEEPTPNIQGAADAQWATHSSIALELCGDTQLSGRILNSNIEDAVTKQYTPASAAEALALGASIADLASLDRALESAGALKVQDHGAIINVRQPRPIEPIPLEAPVPTPAAAPPPQPRMLLVPVAIVWTVLTAFSLCALALTCIVIAYFFRGQ